MSMNNQSSNYVYAITLVLIIFSTWYLSFPEQSCNEKEVSYPHENKYFKTAQAGAGTHTTSCRHSAGNAYPAIPAIWVWGTEPLLLLYAHRAQDLCPVKTGSIRSCFIRREPIPPIANKLVRRDFFIPHHKNFIAIYDMGDVDRVFSLCQYMYALMSHIFWLVTILS